MPMSSAAPPYPRRRGRDLAARRIAEAPEQTALLLDVDGVLAPIVDVPHEAGVPEEDAGRAPPPERAYALVACISGRSGADARRVVGLDELVYVGEHGLELEPEARPGASGCRVRDDDRLGRRRAQSR
jgi:trehalose 6-phosphate phosphatase